jgi:hypothetical protein
MTLTDPKAITSADVLASALRTLLGDQPDPHGFGLASNAIDDAKRGLALAALAQYDATQGGRVAQPTEPKYRICPVVRVVVTIEGGIVQGVFADGPCSVVLVDYDADADDAIDLPDVDDDGTERPTSSPARIHGEIVIHSPAYVATRHRQADHTYDHD